MAGKTILPFGPQHPVLPEPIQLTLTLEDDRVVKAIPHIGYVHRGIEKAAEKMDIAENVFLVERVCGICSFIHGLAYCEGIEQLLGIEAPPRAKYLRVIWSELHRMQSQHLWLGLCADAFGFESLFMEFWRNRELLLDIFEKTAGNRIIISTCAIGGTRRDISDEYLAEILEKLDAIEKGLNRAVPVMLNDPTVKARMCGVGVLSKEQATRLGAAGPVLRASGVAWDSRTLGYAAYGDLNVEPIVETSGDCMARAKVRARECYQSIGLVRQAIERIPSGEFAVRARGNPKGSTTVRVEQPRGELFYLIEADGSKRLSRLRVRTPTFSNVPPLVEMLPGCDVADVPVIILSIDPCISCTER